MWGKRRNSPKISSSQTRKWFSIFFQRSTCSTSARNSCIQMSPENKMNLQIGCVAAATEKIAYNKTEKYVSSLPVETKACTFYVLLIGQQLWGSSCSWLSQLSNGILFVSVAWKFVFFIVRMVNGTLGKNFLDYFVLFPHMISEFGESLSFGNVNGGVKYIMSKDCENRATTSKGMAVCLWAKFERRLPPEGLSKSVRLV